LNPTAPGKLGLKNSNRGASEDKGKNLSNGGKGSGGLFHGTGKFIIVEESSNPPITEVRKGRAGGRVN